ncbi:uncharacterized protein FMAN_13433 [Fusarium mangiferae]|uniref:Uncharacterized protein n=1 Tax=Fusarium mangiferae TaxID=192010 RepID=A0A1L7TKI0_FUSMA|nr:uncharacterized protein FMAN_13433 [Fusarium mangiferae]CVK95306.1 uncharacterized protein FMAN_13433 [Fusarium mangiferae]
MSSQADPLLVNIYDALRHKFDIGDKTLFQIDSNFAPMIKPIPVTEAEFRLTDGILELSNIVGGPNGSKLSEKYDQVLSGLISADHADEEPQQAREDMRSCVNRNMDDTEDIYLT